MVNNSQGLRADSTGATALNPIRVSVQDSSASHHTYAGFTALAAGGATVHMMIEGSSANFNGGAGFAANGAGALIRLGRSVSTGNGTGTLQVSSGVVESYQTNQVRGNTSDGTRTNISQE